MVKDSFAVVDAGEACRDVDCLARQQVQACLDGATSGVAAFVAE